MSQVNFLDYRLSDKVAFGFQGGPDWGTRFTPMKTNGIVRRNRGWVMPQHRYVADYTMLHIDALRELYELQYVVCGAWLAFRFKDIRDHRAVRQFFAFGEGGSAPLQLIKTYTKGPRTFVRTIRLPLSPVVEDEDNTSVPVTVDALTGRVTPVGTWPSGKQLFWTGEFDVPVSLERDFNPLSYDNPSTSKATFDLIEEMAPLIAEEPEDP